MKISIIGTGYVGLVSGVCFAELGNQVICVDNNKQKIANLKKLIMPIFEPGLEDMMRKNVKKGNLAFSSSIKEAIDKTDIIFIAVGTPSKKNGEADLTFIENVAAEIAQSMKSYKLIVEKSTVPVDTGRWIKHTIQINNKKKINFDVASNPEFLREGKAINDFMHPDRVVLGVESEEAKELLMKLYRPLKAPVVVTDIKSAELIKHASNSFLAAKISFINAISQICDLVGADVSKVAEGMGFDQRIGRAFLDAGIGYGGSCFPKDVDAFISIAQKEGYDFSLLKCVKAINEEQKKALVRNIEKTLWILKDKTIGILGLAFKPGTDDMRNAPSLDIIHLLQQEGVKIKVFDPHAMSKAKEVLNNVKFCKDVYDLAKDCDCLVLVTEWDEFGKIDFKRLKKIMKQAIIFDGRNFYDRDKLLSLGFKYVAVGRASK
ncbi:MAG TPA: UDP-glucose/GDP-mannose dehydrogenase family protein [Candidatus Omnitrophota bacterium]|nr:UDP-glucose/GDP-mannose dehydrogenase family protein [Candidatus Omnitrophota bacterium]